VDHSDAFAAKDLVEGGAELAVAVVDQEAHPLEQAGLRLRACWATQAPSDWWCNLRGGPQ
jgi:hypothetical protein